MKGRKSGIGIKVPVMMTVKLIKSHIALDKDGKNILVADFPIKCAGQQGLFLSITIQGDFRTLQKKVLV
jgi:hypothetical protein